MDQVYPDSGLAELVKRMAAGGLVYRLFTNNLTPDRSSALDDFTEATWSGYGTVTLDDTDFTSTGVTAHTGFALGAPISFLNSSGSPQDAYGYFVTDVAHTMVLAAARFDGAPITKDDGESFVVIPVLGDFSELAS